MNATKVLYSVLTLTLVALMAALFDGDLPLLVLAAVAVILSAMVLAIHLLT